MSKNRRTLLLILIKKNKRLCHNKIEEIENAVTNKKSALAWKTINEVSGRKHSNKAKLKATSEKERIQLWHDHFKESGLANRYKCQHIMKEMNNLSIN